MTFATALSDKDREKLRRSIKVFPTTGDDTKDRFWHQLDNCPATRDGLTEAIKAELDRKGIHSTTQLPLRHQGLARCQSGPFEVGEPLVHFGALEDINSLWVFSLTKVDESGIYLAPLCLLSVWKHGERFDGHNHAFYAPVQRRINLSLVGENFHQLDGCPPTREGLTEAIQAEMIKQDEGPWLPLRHQGIARCKSGAFENDEVIVHFCALEGLKILLVYVLESYSILTSTLNLYPVCPLSKWNGALPKRLEPK